MFLLVWFSFAMFVYFPPYLCIAMVLLRHTFQSYFHVVICISLFKMLDSLDVAKVFIYWSFFSPLSITVQVLDQSHFRLVIGQVISIQMLEEWGVKALTYMKNLCQLEEQMWRLYSFLLKVCWCCFVLLVNVIVIGCRHT